MADIELVIKIPEDIYTRSKIIKYGDAIEIPHEAIANGVPLPKGHGDLKDADMLKSEMIKAANIHKTVGETIDDTLTIVKADKEK